MDQVFSLLPWRCLGRTYGCLRVLDPRILLDFRQDDDGECACKSPVADCLFGSRLRIIFGGNNFDFIRLRARLVTSRIAAESTDFTGIQDLTRV